MNRYYLLHGCSVCFLERWEILDFTWKYREDRSEWINICMALPEENVSRNCFSGPTQLCSDTHYLVRITETGLWIMGKIRLIEYGLAMSREQCMINIGARLETCPHHGEPWKN